MASELSIMWDNGCRFGKISAKIEAFTTGNTLTIAEWLEYWDTEFKNYLVRIDNDELLPTSYDVAFSKYGRMIINKIGDITHAEGHTFSLMLVSDYLISQHGTTDPIKSERVETYETV